MGLGRIITDIDDGLFAGLLTDTEPPMPAFDSVQSLDDVLQTSLGLLESEVDATFDPIENELTFAVDLDATLAATAVPLDFDLDLSPLVEINTGGEVTVSVEAGLAAGPARINRQPK